MYPVYIIIITCFCQIASSIILVNVAKINIHRSIRLENDYSSGFFQAQCLFKLQKELQIVFFVCKLFSYAYLIGCSRFYLVGCIKSFWISFLQLIYSNKCYIYKCNIYIDQRSINISRTYLTFERCT